MDRPQTRLMSQAGKRRTRSMGILTSTPQPSKKLRSNGPIDMTMSETIDSVQIEEMEATGEGKSEKSDKKPRKKHSPLKFDGHTWHMNKAAGNTIYLDCAK